MKKKLKNSIFFNNNYFETLMPESLLILQIRQVSWLAYYCFPSHLKLEIRKLKLENLYSKHLKSKILTVDLQLTITLLAYSCGYSSGFKPDSLLMNIANNAKLNHNSGAKVRINSINPILT
jgi:hypothetical protein